MLKSVDIIAAKIAVQLGAMTADTVRQHLRALAADTATQEDLVARLARSLPAEMAWRIRDLAHAFERARSEAAYLRALDRASLAPAEKVAPVLADLHRAGWSKSVGDALVEAKVITAEQHQKLDKKHSQTQEQEAEKIIERYRAEDFQGAGKPLKPGKLDADAVSIFKLFAEGLPAVSQAAKLLAAPPKPVAPAPPPKRPRGLTRQLVRSEMDAVKKIADYDIVNLLGKGGMGAVYLGQKYGMNLYVAIKVMLLAVATDVAKKRFAREVALGRRMNHKFVMGIMDSGETEDGLTYLVVPALVGKELKSLLDKAAPNGLEPDVALRIFENVLEGMQAIHDEHIVHRDMKPENVMVLSGGARDVKIMDFGLARLMGEPDPEDEAANFKTMGEDVTGSPPYIAPETILKHPIDGRTDVYSLGCMFFQMLTGKLPFESTTPTGFITQHVAMPAPTLAETRPDRTWPPELEKLIERMLSKTLEERPTCNEILGLLRGGLGAAIRAALEGKAPATGPDEPVPVASEAPKLPATVWATQAMLGRLVADG